MFRRNEKDGESVFFEENGAAAPESAGKLPTQPPRSAVSAPQPAEGSATAARPSFRNMEAAASPQRAGNAPQRTGSAQERTKRVLTVGPEILLKGEIATCDRLIVEGAVDAKLTNVHTVVVAESGSFKGGAEIQDAEISGVFDGDLTVHNRLIVRSTGQVRGKITYGEIQIERGGQISGEVIYASDKRAAAASTRRVQKVEEMADAAA